MRHFTLVVIGMGLAVNAFGKTYEYEKGKGVVYATPGGKSLEATLYLPKDDGKSLRPGIVLIHGGGWIIGTRYQQQWYCRHLAENGYVVMTIEYRLLPKYGFPHCLHDCKAAVRWLRANAATYRVDPERIGAFGASAGGHLAAFLATTEPADGFEGTEDLGPSSEVKCVISLYGAVDLTAYRPIGRRRILGPLGKRLMRKFTRDLNAKEGEDPLALASPVTYAKATTPPILFVHGTRDSLVNYRQSERFYNRLRELGVPTRLITLPNRQHGFDYVHVRQRREIFEQMLAFLHTYLDPTDEQKDVAVAAAK